MFDAISNYFSCICEIRIRIHVAIVWNMHRKIGCCSLGWLLKNVLSGPVSYRPFEWFTPDSLWNNELNLGEIVSVLYLTSNCKSTKLKGSQIKLKKILLNFTDRCNGSLHLFFVWPVHPARASKEYIQTSDIQDGCPVAWPVTLGELHDNDRLQGPWTRIQLENESNRKPMRSQILPARMHVHYI